MTYVRVTELVGNKTALSCDIKHSFFHDMMFLIEACGRSVTCISRDEKLSNINFPNFLMCCSTLLLKRYMKRSCWFKLITWEGSWDNNIFLSLIFFWQFKTKWSSSSMLLLEQYIHRRSFMGVGIGLLWRPSSIVKGLNRPLLNSILNYLRRRIYWIIRYIQSSAI